MSTFNLALFLPYTVDFSTGHPVPTPHRRAPLQSPEPTSPQTSYFPRHSTTSLLGHPPTPPHRTHSEGHIDAHVFTPLDPSSPALHFATPHDPKSLARTDLHVPEWGRGRVFNQPQSKAGVAPPSTILQYAKAHEQLQELHKPKSEPTLPTPRASSADKKFSQGSFSIEPQAQGNGGLTNAVRAASEFDTIDRLWVGTLGFPTDVLEQRKKDDIEEQLENDFQALTVFVNDVDFDGHYNHYCKTILWPVFHYVIPDHPKSKAFEDHSWKYYVKVNEAFAERVVKSYKHGDVIWIHDYHLLLVPKLIRQRLPDARIGFFLHTAFPSSEVFRCLAARRQLLEGMLGANLIAFQAPEYANHFLQSCSRLLVVEVTNDGVQLESHFVDVTAVPIGIVPQQLNAARQNDEVKAWTKIIRDKYAGKFLIVARDKLDNIRGVKQKLVAYELFLDKNPQYADKVVLIQVATSTINEQRDLDSTVSDIVTRINSRHSTLAHQPMVFLKQDIVFSQYLALLTAADALMITSLRDGMNLTCHEYILCQDGQFEDKKWGPLILSEFTGSAAIFDGLDLSVNPWDSVQTSKAIKHAVEMGEEEREVRYKALHRIVMQRNGIDWIKTLERELETAYDGHQQRDTMCVPRLSTATLSGQYRDSKIRLFLLDYEGTLAAWRTETGTPSPQRMMDTLTDLLSSSDRNIVYVTSSRTSTELERVFSQVPNLGLVAENGCFVRPFGHDEWIDLSEKFMTPSWKDGVLSILSYYRDRIEGSYIEERKCGVVFHYGNVSPEDSEAAERNAGDCVNHINDSCESQRMRAVPAEKMVIVESSDVGKITAAKWILRSFHQPGDELPDITDLSLSGESSAAIRTPASDNRSREGSLSEAGSSEVTGAGLHNGEESVNGITDGPASRRPRRSTLSTIASRRSVSGRSVSGKRTNGEDEAFATDLPSHTSSPRGLSSTNTPRSDKTSSPEGLKIKATPYARSIAGLKTPAHPTPDFLMVAGDDREDELVFRWANRLAKGFMKGESGVKHVVTVCVGKRNTEANSSLTQGAPGLLTALQKLS